MMPFRILAALLLGAALAPAAAREAAPVQVFAAASLTEAMSDLADLWAARGHPRPVLVFGASSAMARQIERGAPADVFVSADVEWMDWLAERKLIAPATRRTLAGNRLVVVTPADRPARLDLRRGEALVRLVGTDGRLAIADPAAVPAGRYARAALESLGVWGALAPRAVNAENVRSALAFVERGDAAAGIVYATDAQASARVRVAGVFPAATHPPVVYPAAALASAGADAQAFLRFLRKRGFVVR
jgi:molybdate transport system substrate-binding protein